MNSVDNKKPLSSNDINARWLMVVGVLGIVTSGIWLVKNTTFNPSEPIILDIYGVLGLTVSVACLAAGLWISDELARPEFRSSVYDKG